MAAQPHREVVALGGIVSRDRGSIGLSERHRVHQLFQAAREQIVGEQPHRLCDARRRAGVAAAGGALQPTRSILVPLRNAAILPPFRTVETSCGANILQTGSGLLKPLFSLWQETANKSAIPTRPFRLRSQPQSPAALIGERSTALRPDQAMLRHTPPR